MRKNRKIYIALILFIACFLFVNEVFAKPNYGSICKYGQRAGFGDITYRNGKWSANLSRYLVDGTELNDNDFKSYKKTFFSTTDDTKKIAFGFPEKEEDFNSCPVLCKYRPNISIGGKKEYYAYVMTKKNEDPSCDNFPKRFIFGGKAEMIASTTYNVFDEIDKEYIENGDKLRELANDMEQLCMTEDQINGNWITSAEMPASQMVNKIANTVGDDYFYESNKDSHLATKVPFLFNYVSSRIDKSSSILAEITKEKCEKELEEGKIDQQTYDNTSNAVSSENYNWSNSSGFTITKEYRERLDTGYGSSIKNEPTTEVDCNSILGGEMTKLVENVLKFIRFLGPVLVIVLTIIDFVSAVFSADLSITKPLGKLIRRLIAAALLFFLPTIIIPLFNYLHITMSDTCMQFLQ